MGAGHAMGKVKTMTQTKKLLICPNCEANGRKEILAEMDGEGNLIILRFSDKRTKVVSPNMSVQCGNCGETVFYRRKQ